MKKIIFLFLTLALLTSCEKTDLSNTKHNVMFIMNGLQVDYTSRATLASEGMTDLWVFEGTTLLCHKVSTDADFASPVIALTLGEHNLTFVASKADGQQFTDHWRCSKIKDTFGTTLTYTVSSSTTTKQVDMHRLVSKVLWTIEDAIPSNAKTIKIDLSSACYGLNASLQGTDSEAISAEASIESHVGETGFAPAVTVLPTDGSGTSINASITIKSATATLCSYTNAVTLKANQMCNIHGSFFSQGTTHQMTISSTWGITVDYNL